MIKRFVVAAVAALVLAALGTHLSAYMLSGHRWAGNQVPFFVNPVNQDVSEDAAIVALQAAASNWRAQSTADINVYYAGRTTGASVVLNGKNEIFFRNEANGGTAAVTYWWYGSDGKFLDSDMMFYDAGFKFFTGQSGCSGGIYIEDLASHEFGHFIGIQHSADASATMYPTVSAWCGQDWRYLSQDDIAAVQSTYPASTATSGAPVAPSSLVAGLGATTPQVNLVWADTATNETGFKVERSTDGVNFVIIGQPGANVTSYLDQSTASGQTYSYRVRSFNANGVSAASNIASIQTQTAVATPAQATAYSPKNGASRVTLATTNYLRWNAAARATSYDVYFGTSSKPPMIGTVTPPAGVSAVYPGTLYRVVPWSAKKTYYWRIVAKNAGGATSSPVWKFSTR